jgi:microcystin-dependent protein
MSNAFLGEIKMVGFDYPPRGWALCNGQLLSIAQNSALFSILGTSYGGDGQSTFALPDLRGRVPIHVDGSHSTGQVGGEPTHTLTIQEIPTHAHSVSAASSSADIADPAGKIWAAGSQSGYAAAANVTMAPQAIGTTGGSQPHDNMSPYLVTNFVIALQGIFPSRN